MDTKEIEKLSRRVLETLEEDAKDFARPALYHFRQMIESPDMSAREAIISVLLSWTLTEAARGRLAIVRRGAHDATL